MQSEFIFEMAEAIRRTSDDDFEKYNTSEYFFFSQYPHLKDEYYSYKQQRIKDSKYKDETWSAFVREIRLWHDLDLPYMYSRIMELAQNYKGNFDYFDIKTDYGVYVVPDRITLLNKLLNLSYELLHEIYPKIEQSLNYESDIDRLESATIHGKVDWNQTIINAVNQSLKHPISFVSVIPTQDFDTPENLLILVALSWIRNDSLRLMKHYQPGELSKKELSTLQQIFVKSETALNHSILKNLHEQASIISSIGHKNRKITDLINQIIQRLRTGIIRQTSYKALLDWVNRYTHFNTERFAKDLVNFRVENTQDVDTMYELWILFELMRHLDTAYHIEYDPIVESDRSFHGFEVKINNKKFKLRYQESYPGQVHIINTPDYTLELSKNSVPIILDAKNWRNEKSDAKNKMIVYLVELSTKKAEKGILFFPNNVRLEENKDSPYFEKQIMMGDHKPSLVTCILRPSQNLEIQKQNSIVLDHITKLIMSVI